jgi:hypothetical protein
LSKANAKKQSTLKTPQINLRIVSSYVALYSNRQEQAVTLAKFPFQTPAPRRQFASSFSVRGEEDQQQSKASLKSLATSIAANLKLFSTTLNNDLRHSFFQNTTPAILKVKHLSLFLYGPHFQEPIFSTKEDHQSQPCNNLTLFSHLRLCSTSLSSKGVLINEHSFLKREVGKIRNEHE